MIHEHSDARVGSQAITPPAKFAHVALRTARFRETVSWYKTVLGAKAAFENSEISFLTYDDEHHRIAIVRNPDLTPSSDTASGIHHISFTYDALPDLMSNYDRLKKQGIEPVWCINHGPTTSMYYLDPDDNRVELQVENFPDLESSYAYFASKEFAANPIGVEFDPDELLERARKGEVDLTDRGNIGNRGVSNLNLR
ncbi:VOC family protein [Sphingomonas sp. MG17]|uniref:VOC family protein n=1 Tax=Sphingomonas tagetis TaxID=2949092 RepID=A0A9X2HFP3_9SPHN|nr:VOC family protein [Sphingomonas tagetis]MCP3730276.1 VOC family protein [Sphingomonas tagetis]